jgi:hypothetical protein
MNPISNLYLREMAQRTGFTRAALRKFYATSRGQEMLASGSVPTYADVYRGANENPLMGGMTTGMKVALGVAVVGGVGAAIWYATRPAAASAAATTLVLAPGNQSATLTTSGLTLTLPAGATWGTGVTDPAGTSITGTATPLTISLQAGTPAGSSQTFPVPWVDATGAAVTTQLTLTASSGTVGAPNKKLALNRETVAIMRRPFGSWSAPASSLSNESSGTGPIGSGPGNSGSGGGSGEGSAGSGYTGGSAGGGGSSEGGSSGSGGGSGHYRI